MPGADKSPVSVTSTSDVKQNAPSAVGSPKVVAAPVSSSNSPPALNKPHLANAPTSSTASNTAHNTPASNAAAPNAAAPNAAAPNAAASNTATHNGATPNAAASNATAPNGAASNAAASNAAASNNPASNASHNTTATNSPVATSDPKPTHLDGAAAAAAAATSSTTESKDAHSDKGILHTEPYMDGKYIEPPFVKPIHFSDIDQWKLPERNYYVFVCISFVLGFFGMDHFYLRSFGTGTQKFIFNLLSLGFWWWWDILQIATNSSKVQAEGLTTPFDWVRGVGRGVFEDPKKKAEALENGGKIVRVKKDIAIYALLTVLAGIFGADKFYLGETYQGIAKMLSVFNFFTFLFGLMWVFWDIVKVFFYTESLLKDGISPPPPFTMLFHEAIKAKEMFMPEEVSKDQLDKEAAEASKKGPLGGFALPIIGMDTFRFWYKELAVPLLQPTVGTTVQTVDKSVKLGEKAAAVGGEVMSAGPKIASAVTQNMASALNPTLIMEQVQQAAANKAQARLGVHTGGGNSSSSSGEKGLDISSGPIIAGTLMAVVLAGAGKFVTDIIYKQK